jgi:iron complex transport system permease protein
MALPYVALGQVVALAHARDLNGMLFGDEQARQLGIDVSRARAVLVGAACLMAAAAVATSGLIAFVGLVVPHMVRLLVGPDYRWMLLGAPLAGAVTLVAADVVARTVVSPAELPVGVLTALLGAPFFLYLLRRRRQL